jgi:hypothetical protein
MVMRKFVLPAAALLAACTLAGPAHAGAPIVEISRIAFDPATRTATVTVKVVHAGETASHYTGWLSIRANGSEVKRFEFGPQNRSEGETFERTVTAGVLAPLTIEAEAACVKNGGHGIARIVFTADKPSVPDFRYADARAYLWEAISVYDAFVNGIAGAGSAEDVAAAMNTFTGRILPLAARGKELDRKHPELKLKDSRNPPAELAEEMRMFEELTRRLMAKSVMDKLMKYASDPLVQKAQRDMAEKLKNM